MSIICKDFNSEIFAVHSICVHCTMGVKTFKETKHVGSRSILGVYCEVDKKVWNNKICTGVLSLPHSLKNIDICIVSGIFFQIMNDATFKYSKPLSS